MTQALLRAGAALVLAALLVGFSAQARSPYPPDATTVRHAMPAYGHTTNEWLMMGRACGAGMTGT